MPKQEQLKEQEHKKEEPKTTSEQERKEEIEEVEAKEVARGEEGFSIPIASEKSVSDAGDRVNTLYETIKVDEERFAETNKELDEQFGEGWSKKHPELALQHYHEKLRHSENKNMQKVYIFAFSALAFATGVSILSKVLKR